VVGVEPEKLPSMLRAREAGAPVTIAAEATIADGIAVRRAGDLTLPLVNRYVDEIVSVDDEEIASAILMLLEQEKTLAEGAGAAALAAVVQSKTNLRPRRTVVLVCGGNIDVTLLAKIIERGLVKDGRLLRVRVYLQDRPGALLALTHILARERANIVETLHNRAYYGVSLGETVIDVTLETRGATHITAISHALREAGFRFERIQLGAPCTRPASTRSPTAQSSSRPCGPTPSPSSSAHHTALKKKAARLPLICRSW
jgi:threonine dehydratase